MPLFPLFVIIFVWIVQTAFGIAFVRGFEVLVVFHIIYFLFSYGTGGPGSHAKNFTRQFTGGIRNKTGHFFNKFKEKLNKHLNKTITTRSADGFEDAFAESDGYEFDDGL